MKLPQSLAFALVLVTLAVAPACSKPDPAADGGAPGASALPPVPAPRGLLADLYLPAPDASWSKARAVVGGPMAFLPQTFGGLVATLLGLPITVAGEIDGAIPTLGAVVDSGGEGPPHGAVGIHVRAGERFLDQLTKGDAARFKGRADPPSSIVLLDPIGADVARGPVALGVLGNYLLVAKTESDLLAVGPYVARTMPAAPPPKNDLTVDVPRAAMAGPVRAWVAKATAFLRAEPGDTSAGYVTAPLLTALDVVADSSALRLTVALDKEVVRARATITPNEGTGSSQAALAALSTGDAKSILDLPAGSVGALLLRESATSRTASATRQTEALAALGGKMPAADREAIAATLKSLAEARGDWMLGGLSWDSSGPAACFRAAVSDPDKLGKAMKDLVELMKRPSIKAELAELGLSITAGKTKVEGMSSDIQRLRFERVQPKDAKTQPVPGMPTSIDMLYTVTKDAMLVAVGLDAKQALVTLAAAPGKDDLSKNPLVTAAVESLGNEVALAFVLEPLRLVARRAGKPDVADSAPVVVAFGRGAPEEPAPRPLWLRVDVANTAVREIVKYRGAF